MVVAATVGAVWLGLNGAAVGYVLTVYLVRKMMRRAGRSPEPKSSTPARLYLVHSRG